MTEGVANGPAETRAVGDFLTSAALGPSALVVEGEPGIGKTTLWLAAVEQARRLRFSVLSARPAEAESGLAYAAVADLLRDIDPARLAALPPAQRLAADRVLLRADASGLATDPRATGAALLSVVEDLATDAPVLLALDDVHWLDPSSIHAISSLARRLTGRVGLLATVRTDSGTGGMVPWLQMPRPEATARIALRPLGLGALQALVTERLSRPFSRPAMLRIQAVSQGNPFYALELARAFNGAAPMEDGPLPATLADLVRARIGSIGSDLRRLLLAAACLAEPTRELLLLASDLDEDQARPLLEHAEGKGIIAFDGHRVRFSHPLLAAGVHADAEPGQRRAMHRRLAALVREPELRARHLALAAVRGDAQTLRALDAAAVHARIRGAPAAAAELLARAVGLGGDSPERRLRLARHHFDAGESDRARTVLERSIRLLPPGTMRARTVTLLAFVRLHDDSFREAAELLRAALTEVGGDLELRVEILTRLAYAEVNTGEVDRALRSVEDAVADGERVSDPQLASEALGLRVTLRFLHGDGLDGPGLTRALQLADEQGSSPVAFRPSVQAALLRAWTGDLDQAHVALRAIRGRCLENGEENDLMFVAFHSALVESWRGDFAEAALVAEDAMERALQLKGDVPLAIARSMRAGLAAYAGRVDEARSEASEAVASFLRCGWHTLASWPVAIMVFLDVSLGEYEAAVAAVAPLLATCPPSPEIASAPFVPDAAEALIHVGRLDQADALVSSLESSGRRLDRPWALATGGRCRSMLLAARGDVEAALVSAERAMVEHRRLPMPFERARTQLLLGQLQRRLRHRDVASGALTEALRLFEQLETPLWAARARAELARGGGSIAAADGLTRAERRVAELAATGMTNRSVAAAMFISPKTVEAHLARVYRKLDIRSRAELGQRMR